MLKQLKNVNERYQILIFASRTMYSELCISTDRRVSHIQWGHVSLIDRLHSCTGQSTVIISRLPTFPPHTLLIQPHTFPQPSSFCASYLFILFSASTLLPLAQVLTPRLSCRLMIRALLCLSLFFPSGYTLFLLS